MNIPDNRKYTKEHEWVKQDGSVVTVGVTEYAVGQLGDITLVEMPEVDDDVAAGDVIGTIESVKAVSDIYSPLSGKVVGVNEDLEDAPEEVNDDCMGDGWIVKLEIQDSTELNNLLDATAYSNFIDSIEE